MYVHMGWAPNSINKKCFDDHAAIRRYSIAALSDGNIKQCNTYLNLRCLLLIIDYLLLIARMFNPFLLTFADFWIKVWKEARLYSWRWGGLWSLGLKKSLISSIIWKIWRVEDFSILWPVLINLIDWFILK